MPNILTTFKRKHNQNIVYTENWENPLKYRFTSRLSLIKQNHLIWYQMTFLSQSNRINTHRRWKTCSKNHSKQKHFRNNLISVILVYTLRYRSSDVTKICFSKKKNTQCLKYTRLFLLKMNFIIRDYDEYFSKNVSRNRMTAL